VQRAFHFAYTNVGNGSLAMRCARDRRVHRSLDAMDYANAKRAARDAAFRRNARGFGTMNPGLALDEAET
jgi:hypothetical protein